MPAVTVAHAVFAWDEGGVSRLAMRGESIDVTDETVEHYERFGVFATEAVDPIIDTPPPAASNPFAAEPIMPRASSSKALWHEYATALGLDTHGLDKDQIIAAVGELHEENTHD